MAITCGILLLSLGTEVSQDIFAFVGVTHTRRTAMADRIINLVVGLERLADDARMRGADIAYTQQQERLEHVRWLDQLLDMVDRVRTTMLEERKKFMPVEEKRQVTQQSQAEQKHDSVPKFLKQGPAAV
jgi:hypothetical protein